MGGANTSRGKCGKRFQRLIILIAISILSVAVLAIGWVKNGKYFAMTATYSSSARVVIESVSKRILSGINYTARLPMASTTKVVTAYLACISGKLDDIVIVPKAATNIEGSSIYLLEGEGITLRDLTYGLMMQSGNDAATAIAIYLGGSVQGFADMMNDTAKGLGLVDCHYVNPHGLHDDEHFTSAYDLAYIAATAMQKQDFRDIVSTKTHRIKSSLREDRVIANKNKMLSMYDGANGIKTGYTKKAGRCLVSAANRDGVQLVSVVLNEPDMWNQSISLLDSGFGRCKSIDIVKSDVELCKVRLAKSNLCAPIAARGSYSHVFMHGDDMECTEQYEYNQNIKLPLKKGDNIGILKIFNQNHLIFQTNIYTMIDVNT